MTETPARPAPEERAKMVSASADDDGENPAASPTQLSGAPDGVAALLQRAARPAGNLAGARHSNGSARSTVEVIVAMSGWTQAGLFMSVIIS